MAALTGPRFNADRLGKDAVIELLKVPLKANAKVWAGGLAATDASGYGIEATGATGQTIIGIWEQSIDNTGGANGDKTGEVRRGTFAFNNSTAGDAITQADFTKVVYVADDNTVAKTDNSGARVAAGRMLQLTTDGRVLVQVGVLV